MEIRFDRDLRHNYMVLCGLETAEDYRLRMLAENCPRGLLRCSLRNINGAGFLYYEIDSKQPLRNRYADGGLGADDLRRLLKAVDELRETLEDYLLDAEHILFSADCIYTDVRRETFYFAYCPFSAEAPVLSESGGRTDFASFAEELLSFLDRDDEAAARIAYTLCEMAGDGETLLRDAVRAALEEAEEPAGEGRSEGDGTIGGAQIDDAAYDEIFRPRAPRDSFDELPVSEMQRMDEAAAAQGAESPKKRPAPPVFALLFAAVFAGNLVIRARFFLNARENLLSLAVAGVSLLMAVVSFALWLNGAKGSEEDGGESGAEGEPDGWIRAQMEEAELFGGRAAEQDERSGRAAGGSFRRYDPSEDGDEETTVLSEAEVPCARKLYGRNGGETINIPLERLPLTVGKLSGCADFVIRDPSISRMHTRFFGDAPGAVQMKDLNSTNGTFLNGRRLRPNETASIRPGDEIGIGRLVFELR